MQTAETELGDAPKPRILILVNAFEPDAPTRLMISVAAAVARTGEFDCSIAALSRGGPAENDARAACGSAHVLSSRSLGHLHGARALGRLLREYKPDILHTSLTRPALTGAAIARRIGIKKVVLTHHGSHEWHEHGRLSSVLVPKLYPIAARAAVAVVAVSNAVKLQLESAGIAADKICVIHNGVDEEVYNPSLRVRRGQILRGLFPDDDPDSSFLIGAAGRLEKYKGHKELIEAADRLHLTVPTARFVVWGKGEERDTLASLISYHKLSKVFLLAGHCGEMPARLAACDVFVQPSVEEAFGIAAAEAMACSTATVVSNAGGLPELVQDGISGCVFRKADSESLAATLEGVLMSKSRREQMGEGGRKRILENFTLERMTCGYLNLYRRLIGLPQ